MSQALSLTFGAFAPISVDRRTLTEGTAEGYMRLLAHATPVLGRLRVGAITRAHVQECLADCRTHMGAKSVRNVLKFVRSVLRDAGSAASDGLTVPVHEPDIRVLDAAEIGALRDFLTGLGTHDALALLVLLGTGLRRGELLNLTRDNWWSGRRQLHVSRSKSRRVRDVDVPEWLIEGLDALAQKSPAKNSSERLFDTNKDALRRLLDKACEETGLPHIRIHDLRHTRITYLLLNSVTPLYVSQQAGHGSPSFTLARYGHLIAATPTQRHEWCNV